MANYFFGPSPYLTQNTLSVIQNSNCELLKVYVGLRVDYVSVSQPPGRGPVPGPGINYTGPREAWGSYSMLQDFISPVDN